MTTAKIDSSLLKGLSVLVLALAVAAVFMAMIRSFLIALFLAAAFSAMAYPLFERINKAIGGRRGLAAAVTLVVLISAVVLPVIALLQVVADQAGGIKQSALPWIQEQMQEPTKAQIQLPDWIPFSDRLQTWVPTIAAKLGELSSKIGEFAVKIISGVTSGAAGFLLNLFVMLYAMFYFLKEGPALLSQLERYALVPGSVQQRVFERALTVTRATVKGTLVIGIVQGILGGVGFAIFGIPGAAFWGTVMAIASMLPVVGTALIWIPGVIFLAANGDTNGAVGLAIWSAVIVSNIDNVLRPILVGGDTEMPDLLVLISTFGGLAMFGGAGLILGPVIAAVCSTMIEISDTMLQDSEPVAVGQQSGTPTVEKPDGGEPQPSAEQSSQPNEAVGKSQGLLEVGLSESQKLELAQLREQFKEIKGDKPSSR